MGKDVTLHVSASNPAMLLYQKFGFKAEELVLDFYDKYLPAESTECRNAYFLRLRRWYANVTGDSAHGGVGKVQGIRAHAEIQCQW